MLDLGLPHTARRIPVVPGAQSLPWAEDIQPSWLVSQHHVCLVYNLLICTWAVLVISVSVPVFENWSMILHCLLLGGKAPSPAPSSSGKRHIHLSLNSSPTFLCSHLFLPGLWQQRLLLATVSQLLHPEGGFEKYKSFHIIAPFPSSLKSFQGFPLLLESDPDPSLCLCQWRPSLHLQPHPSPPALPCHQHPHLASSQDCGDDLIIALSGRLWGWSKWSVVKDAKFPPLTGRPGIHRGSCSTVPLTCARL